MNDRPHDDAHDDPSDHGASPVNEELLSAWLDHELDEDDAAAVELALRGDATLERAASELASVQDVLRSSEVAPRPGALERIIAAVDAAEDSEPGAGDPHRPAVVVDLASRRRVPSIAAIAAALVIIAGVVGGLGGPAGSLPAIGDLVAQHEAAAAVAPSTDDTSMDEMPMDGMDAMPMDEAETVVSMPHEMTMRHAFANGDTVHLVYETTSGEALSIFRHTGETDIDGLGDGDVSQVSAGPMWATDLEDNHVVVIDGSGYVWVVIGPTDDDMMDDMMDDLPARETSVGDRVRACADAAVEPFRFWD